MKHKFEVIKSESNNGTGYTVRTVIGKDKQLHTVCETFMVPGIGNAQEIADIVAKALQDREEMMTLKKKSAHFYSPHTDRCVWCDAFAEDELMAPTKCGCLQQ